MRKRLVILALICVLTASLPACGSQETSSTITIDEKVDESVALSMFVPVGVDLGGTDSFRDLTLAYNKQDSKIRITVDSVSTADGFDDFLEKRLDTKDAVDIFVVNAENVKDIAQKGQFYDLSGLKSFHELTKSAKEQAMVGDIAYSIPLKMAVYVMDVNVSLLKQYDLEVPENYEDFLHCCQVLKKQNITPISLNRWWAMVVPVMARSLYPIYQAENQRQLIDGLNKGDLKIGDYMINGFRMFEEFLKNGYYGEGLTMEKVDAIKANTQDRADFLSSKTAFRFFPIEELKATEMENEDKAICTGIPMLPDGVITLPSISVRLCVNGGSSHLEDSIKFVDYLTSQREELLSSDTSGSLSPFKRPAETKAEVPWKQAVLELLDGGGQIPLEDMNLRFGCWDNTRQLCLKMIGGMSAEDAAKEFNRIQMEEIQAYEEKQALEGGAGGE